MCVLSWPIFVCTVVTNFCVYCCDQFLCVLLVLPVHTYLYICICIAYLYLVPVYLYIRTCISYLYTCTCVPVHPYLYSVPVSRTSVPSTYLGSPPVYVLTWYLGTSLTLDLASPILPESTTGVPSFTPPVDSYILRCWELPILKGWHSLGYIRFRVLHDCM